MTMIIENEENTLDNLNSKSAPLLFAKLHSLSHLRMLKSESDVSETYEKIPFKMKNSEFCPLQSQPDKLDAFQDLIEQDLVQLNGTLSYWHITQNVTIDEREALQDIQRNEDLIVQKVDKRGAIVILNGGLYSKLNFEILWEIMTLIVCWVKILRVCYRLN